MSECPSRAADGKEKDRRAVNGIDEKKEAKRFTTHLYRWICDFSLFSPGTMHT